MFQPEHPERSVGRQCRLLSISQSPLCYHPKGVTAMNLALMRRIDQQFLETPFLGVRQMTWHQRNEALRVNERRIRRLMRFMGVRQKPNTSKAAKGHKTYPSLLRGLRVDLANQGLGRRHHLPADAKIVPVSAGDHGLANPQGVGLTHLENSPSRRLPAIPERSAGRRTSAARR